MGGGEILAQWSGSSHELRGGKQLKNSRIKDNCFFKFNYFQKKKKDKNNGSSSYYVLTVSATVLGTSYTKSHFILITALHVDVSTLTPELRKPKLKEIKKLAWAGGENGQTLVKRYKLPIIRWIVWGDLIHSMVIIVNHIVLYTWK